MADAVHLLQGGNARYDSPQIFNEMLASISTVLMASAKAEIGSSPFIGIGVDESTDRGNEKHLAIVVRYATSACVMKTGFMARVKVSYQTNCHHVGMRHEDRLHGLREGKLPEKI